MKTNIFMALLLLIASIFIMDCPASAGEAQSRGMPLDRGASDNSQGTGTAVPDLRNTPLSDQPRSDRQKEVAKVLGVFERRINDDRLIARVRHKLDTVHESRLQMISSLSDRIHQEERIDNTIAFLLLTTLVILS